MNRVSVSWPTRTARPLRDLSGPVQARAGREQHRRRRERPGIYVGQSDTIVVRNNVVTNNVSGIEIENSFNADVTGNDSNDNTVGFLVFDLPNLPQVGGHNVRVYANQFGDNNHPNFGDPAALLPWSRPGPAGQ